MAPDDKTRELIVKKLDLDKFYGESEGLELKDLGGGQLQTVCPFHDDTNPSFSISPTGVWFCHAGCGGGSVFDFYMRRHTVDYKEARRVLGEMAGVSIQGSENQEPIPEPEVAKWHEDLLKHKQMLAFLREERGYTDATIKKYQLGWNGERITIPVRDIDKNLVNVRMYLPHAGVRKQKMIGYKQGYNKARLLNPWSFDVGDEVILCEGEMDCILLLQEGFNAQTVTSGAGTWNPDWTKLFTGKRVIMCFDNDLAGREGTTRVGTYLSKAADVYVVKWPSNLATKGDVTDYFVNLGHTRDDFLQMAIDAVKFVPPGPDVKKHNEEKALEVPLTAATLAKFLGKRLKMKAFVNGKEMAPYVAPKTVEFTCAGRGDKSCEGCPSFIEGGKTTVDIGADDSGILKLIDVSDADQRRVLKETLGVNTSCPAIKIEVTQQQNVEILNLIPEIDSSPTGVDDEYITRQAYSLSHGIRTNRSYEIEGFLWPNPKNQMATHLLDTIRPAQDSISDFKLSTEMASTLHELFTPKKGETIDQKLKHIYTDFEANVHRIRGRFNAQVGFDLVWHSVLAFYFNGAYVRKGWVEGLILGDSGQGKSEMANGLLRHYRVGDRIQGEVTSGAGLVGGLEKMGEHWILRWGKIPQNDRRLLIIDEFSGIDPLEVAKMSDLRTTGVAEVVKIRIEKANARTRLLFMSNPREGMPLSAYDQGVQAIKRLFEKMEDVRRLDFALVVASGEVDPHIINQLHNDNTPHVYISEACRQLILWAWSMEPASVHFSSEAVTAILKHAGEMGDTYSSKIPLVEPADQRLKLARMAASLAARMFSTEDHGKTLSVTAGHVEYVVAWLHEIYDNPYMAYHAFSKLQKDTERDLEGPEKQAAITALAALPSFQDLITSLSEHSYAFKRAELQDQLGYSNDEVRDVLKTLSKYRLVRTTSRGYAKQPHFIRLLRELATPEGLVLLIAAKNAATLEGNKGEPADF